MSGKFCPNCGEPAAPGQKYCSPRCAPQAHLNPEPDRQESYFSGSFLKRMLNTLASSSTKKSLSLREGYRLALEDVKVEIERKAGKKI